ncbi:cation-transporting P-type ATPase [Methylomonas sp. LL1]|uniref:cation-translocating P-type ATPase n=1 Tax=Methylomonas sp. LL1 TaxID=2785785 RepID=UPI0018C38EE8|nr:cation-transporting P-type ATPase [Methylomonas sp. LL1]QPK61796.1 cation-transporting P-type ATPase [Methylomonas sp. LL1]
MKIHHLSPEEALESLESSPDGLGDSEIEERLHEYGYNRIEEAQKQSQLLLFAQEFLHFFALILWLAAGLAFFAESQQPGEGMAALGYAILGVILINGCFSYWQRHQAEQAIAALQKLLPQQVKVMRDGNLSLVFADELVPGDILVLQEGDNVPADCRLLEAFALRVNNATITGESLPKGRDALPSALEDMTQSRNILLAGTSVVAGEGKALVFATGMHTEFGKIAHTLKSTTKNLSPLQIQISRLSRFVAILATLLGVMFFLIGQAIGLSFWENFMFAIGIIVANVPEGLLPTVTLSLAMATQRMAKRNALIRHLPSVETLGSTTVICTDKTGTLTQNRMAVKQIFLDNRHLPPEQLDGDSLQHHAAFLACAALCHNLKRVEAKQLLGDPMEVALVEMAHAQGMRIDYPKFDEVPFDTDRKRLSTLHNTPQGNILYCKGAVELVLPRCQQIIIDGTVLAVDESRRKQIMTAQQTMADQGLRVLALAYRPLPLVIEAEPDRNMIFSGLVGLEDPPRPEVAQAMAQCHAAGIKVIMITGDHPHTAVAIARQIGLVKSDNPKVIGGERLKKMTGSQLQTALNASEIIFARVGADQKMHIVEALQRKKHVVAVTGDGVNDAPALKKADIGIAMGKAGTDVAKEAADMILLDDNFASIVAAIEEGRAVFDNIRKFLTYILTSNIPEVIPYLAFVLFKIPLPLTIMQILAVDLGTDMLPALGLGVEKPDAGAMNKPPRSQKETLIDWRLLARAYGFLGVLEATAAMAAFFFVLNRGGWQYGEILGRHDNLYQQATTACLTAIIMMQVVNVFICKQRQRGLLSTSLLDNKFILGGVVAEITLILLIVYTPWGNLLFGTAPIEMEVWLFGLPFAAGMLLFEDIRKWLVRRFQLFPLKIERAVLRRGSRQNKRPALAALLSLLPLRKTPK